MVVVRLLHPVAANRERNQNCKEAQWVERPCPVIVFRVLWKLRGQHVLLALHTRQPIVHLVEIESLLDLVVFCVQYAGKFLLDLVHTLILLLRSPPHAVRWR